MSEYTALQQRLMKIRDDLCGGNAAELARRIKKDATYVNRLFYPPGKAGAKGIGLEIMAACNEAFGLPPGYWDGLEERREPGTVYDAMTESEWQLIDDFRTLPDEDQDELREIIEQRATKARGYIQKVLHQLGVTTDISQLHEQKATTAKMSSNHNEGSGSTSSGSSLEAVQPVSPAIKTPAMDREDARHRGDIDDEVGKHRRPGRPRNP